MGYEVNSPVKTIYLPLDSTWLHAISDEDPSITYFFELYNKKYGIDLNDVIYSKGKVNTNKDLYASGIIKFYDPNKLLQNNQTIIDVVHNGETVELTCWLACLKGTGVHSAYGFSLTWNTGADFNDADMHFSEL